MDFQGKTALVAGGGGGLGAAICMRLAVVAVAFLAADDVRFIAGAALPVEDGWTAG